VDGFRVVIPRRLERAIASDPGRPLIKLQVGVADTAGVASDAFEVAGLAADVGLTPRTRRRRAFGAWCARARWPLPAAAAVGAASCALLLVQLGALIDALYRNADNAAVLLLSQSHPAGSIARIGDHPFYEAWWFMRATAGLPGRLSLWQAAPFVVAFLGIAAVAGCAALVAGRAGFVVAAVGLAAMSPPLRAVMLVPEARVGLLLHAAALCAALLTVDRLARAGRMTGRRWAVATAGVAGFTAAGATDQLLLPAAVIPYATAALVVWWCDRSAHSRTIATFAVGTAAAAVGLGMLVTRAMTAAGVVVNHFPVQLVPLAELRRSIGVTLHLFAILAGGGVHTVAGMVALLGLAVVCVALIRGAARLRPRPRPLEDRQRARVLYVTFWAAALLLTLGVVAVTSVSLDHGVYDAAQRYLLGAWCAVVALLAGGATSRLRANVLLGAVAAFGVLNMTLNVSSLRQPWEYGPPPATDVALERFVLGRGAAVGYGGYWDVMPIGLHANGRLRVVPIVALGATGRWAGHFVAANNAWFRPHPGEGRSFLVTDVRLSVPYAPHSLPAVFGHPIASRRFGPLTVYIYAHDLARELDGLTA
jgi:hypothetical protein